MRPTLPVVAVGCILSFAPLAAQAPDALGRRLSARETGCDTLAPPATDSVYDGESVEVPVKAQRLDIEDMPFRAREVIAGRTVLRFIVEPSGRIDRCSIEVVEETTPLWTAAVVKELRKARYEPARHGDTKVRQWVYQLFTYHQDGRLLHGR